MKFAVVTILTSFNTLIFFFYGQEFIRFINPIIVIKLSVLPSTETEQKNLRKQNYDCCKINFDLSSANCSQEKGNISHKMIRGLMGTKKKKNSFQNVVAAQTFQTNE